MTSWSSSSKKSKAPSYSAQTDDTLTKSQGKTGAFRPDVVDRAVDGDSIRKGSFRVASNPTRAGHSSGYHEAFVVTDQVDKMARRSSSSSGLSKMPKGDRGIWKELGGKSIVEKNVRPALEAGDGARTDTARTILSGPDGGVAGHTGSGVSTTGQAPAHDLLRRHSVSIMADPGMTDRAIAVASAATVVMSMAPGQMAATAPKASKLKDKRARDTWEEDRNTAKDRLSVSFSALTPKEKTSVRKHTQSFLEDLGDKRRRMSKAEPSSPRRDPKGTKGSAIAGGDYLSPAKEKARSKSLSSMSLSSSASPTEINLFVSQPFRASRTGGGKKKGKK